MNVREVKRDRVSLDSNNRNQDRRRDTVTRTAGRDRDRDFRSNGGDMARLFVNLGTKDGFYKASFLQFILDMSDLKKDVLGRIDMKEMNSWVEIDKSAAGKMIKAIDGKSYKGRRIRMNDANSR